MSCFSSSPHVAHETLRVIQFVSKAEGASTEKKAKYKTFPSSCTSILTSPKFPDSVNLIYKERGRKFFHISKMRGQDDTLGRIVFPWFFMPIATTLRAWYDSISNTFCSNQENNNIQKSSKKINIPRNKFNKRYDQPIQ
jgi:hypothetical protein